MTYWNNLSGRERLLLGSALGLILILAIVFLLIRPVLSSKDSAERAQSNALRDLQTVQQGLPSLTGQAGVKTGTQPFNRNAVIQNVNRSGLELTRVQPESDGALKIWFEEAPAPQILKFLSDMQSAYAVKISDVQLTRKDGGTVSATITLKPVSA